jgi:hypothetical protein
MRRSKGIREERPGEERRGGNGERGGVDREKLLKRRGEVFEKSWG